MDTERTRRSRVPVRPTETESEEKVIVTSTYGGEERSRNEKISVRRFRVEPAYVRVNVGMTKNMGNYESLRVDVSLTIPCYTEEIDKVFAMAADKASTFMGEELKNYE